MTLAARRDMAGFEHLAVWRMAHEVRLETYDLTGRLPPEERLGLAQQMRRAGYSAPANIAEGNERTSPDDFAHFMDITLGSLAELRYFIILCRELGHLEHAGASEALSKVAGLQRTLREFRDAGRRVRMTATIRSR